MNSSNVSQIMRKVSKYDISVRIDAIHLTQVKNASHFRCLTEVRSVNDRFWRDAEQKADCVFTAQLEHIQSLAGTEKFCEKSTNFQRSICQVKSAAPRATHAALRQLNQIQDREKYEQSKG